MLQSFDPGPIVDRYVSREWLKKNVMRFSEEDIEIMKQQMEKEKPLADEEAEKAAALETGSFFDTEDEKQEPVPKKKETK